MPKRFLLTFLLLSACLLAVRGQQLPHFGMDLEAFRVLLPGLAPDSVTFNKTLVYPETLHGIDGNWQFQFFGNRLHDALYAQQLYRADEATYTAWLKGAEQVIADYIAQLGPPTPWSNGDSLYRQPENFDRRYVNRDRWSEMHHDQKVIPFYHLVWDKGSYQIVIACDFRSSHGDGWQPHGNDPGEQWFYAFHITYAPLMRLPEHPASGDPRFYLQMHVQDFARQFPSLFPDGVMGAVVMEQKADLHGLAGKWYYDFPAGRLTAMHFTYRVDGFGAMTAAQFDAIGTQTRAIIADCKDRFGAPDSTFDRHLHLTEKDLHVYQSEDLIGARWNDANGFQLFVTFERHGGGKAAESYVVSMDFLGKELKGDW